MLKPAFKPLSDGDTIALIAPARSADKEMLEMCIEQLEKSPYQSKVSSMILSDGQHFFSQDTVRQVEEFEGLWREPGTHLIWPIRGGYGSMDWLHTLNFGALTSHRKILVGLSDITALLLAFARHHIPTFLGPVAFQVLDGKAGSSFTRDHFFSMVRGEIEVPHTFESPEMEVIQEGVGEGYLIGGNLTLIGALMGTPYQIQTDGAILLIEEVGEAPYRIDRILNQLKLAGLLQNLQGVILASFKNCHANDGVLNLKLDEVIERYFPRGQTPYPVIRNFNSGHIDRQYTLPYGPTTQYRLDSAEGLTLLHSPFAL